MVSMRSYLAIAATLSGLTYAQSIAEINGNSFISPYRGQTVTNVTGLVTAKYKTTTFWMRSTTPDNDPTTSESIEVYGSASASQVCVGDIIVIGSAVVSEYRSSSSYLYLTELTKATDIVLKSSGNAVKAVVLGQTTTGVISKKKQSLKPPNIQFTSLDNGDVWGVPQNVSQISVVNPVLQPAKYGLDFWESLSGEYVSILDPMVLDVPNEYGDTWVYGNWPVTGKNDRGGLTALPSTGQPATILLVNPLDNSTMPANAKMGDTFAAISGPIVYQYGYYTIQPTTAPKIVNARTPPTQPPTTLTQAKGNTGAKQCKGVTFADYNCENLSPLNTNFTALGRQMCNLMNFPTIISLQEIQDNDGPTDDGVVSANVTLSNLIAAVSGGGCATYNCTQIDPVDDTTGGQPGGNIRDAYLYNPKVVQLRQSRLGPRNATQPTGVDQNGHLTYNPGLIYPNDPTWNSSRRPLVAEWEFLDGTNSFITISVHWTAKSGSSSLFGDARPPVNLGITQRDAEANLTATFVRQIFAANPDAAILFAGDTNEFDWINPITDFISNSGLENIDDVLNIPQNQRYTYLFANTAEKLIHFFLSPKVVRNGGVKLDPLHINTWATYEQETSDHDPSVARVNVCNNS